MISADIVWLNILQQTTFSLNNLLSLGINHLQHLDRERECWFTDRSKTSVSISWRFRTKLLDGALPRLSADSAESSAPYQQLTSQV